MKKTLIILIFLSHFIAFGQDSSATRNHEVYLTLADFSPLNVHLKYKMQIGEKTYLKFGLINLSASHTKYVPNTPGSFENSDLNYSGGVEVGIEFRKAFAKRFSLFHGPNLRYSYSNATRNNSNPGQNQKTVTESHTASIPYSVGLLFNLTPHLLLTAEINPSVNFTHVESSLSPSSKNVASRFDFALDTRGGLISLAWRF